ncbi:DUF6470 family protein [Acetivibrio mesophilus]|mgnify:CR=1 FL=1|uniref:Uncharacterized protein n=1 Tax=Acetivibrio mesophilus TaxID=2487273 RepID=A0A4Q0I3M9_9FIRM|nr:DUF6470 family protein [Acetivibrio mesophilus]ODM27324.1 hypothetical protein A7W90_14480 [Clostridium sp. Bc-iso-3]RXE58838.1 hypothetical protein EFD62_10260 [Acetivibrio mesophilus]HHV29567.1 hypothetical protein [Clostridium sp.]
MGLIISQTYAKIGIDRIYSRLDIESRDAQLNLHQNHAKVNIEAEFPKVQIDQYEAFASAGLKNHLDLRREISQRGHRHALEHIGKVADDGDAMAAIENGGNLIPEIAKRDSYTVREFDIDAIPKASPEVTVTGELEIDFEKNYWTVIHNGVESTFVPARFNLNYTPENIKIFLSQYASIKFDYVENKINTYV